MRAAGVTLALMALPAAHAGMITFENLGTGAIGAGMVPLAQAGFAITTFAPPSGAEPGALLGAILDGTDPFGCFGFDCPSNNTGAYYASYNGGVVDVSPDGAIPNFQLHAFDASAIGQPVSGLASDALAKVRVQGTLANGVVMFEDFTMGGRTATGYAFQHFVINGTFGHQALTDVSFFGVSCGADGTCLRSAAGSNQFALDNISTVPEPSSCLMMAFGLLLVGAGVKASRRGAGQAARA